MGWLGAEFCLRGRDAPRTVNTNSSQQFDFVSGEVMKSSFVSDDLGNW